MKKKYHIPKYERKKVNNDNCVSNNTRFNRVNLYTATKYDDMYILIYYILYYFLLKFFYRNFEQLAR